MTFAIGFACGAAVSLGAAFLGAWLHCRLEWSRRAKIEGDVRKLMRHFACGAGIIGCKGGPNCTWDHK